MSDKPLGALDPWVDAARTTDPARIEALSMQVHSSATREACARNPYCPASVVERLSRDISWRVRVAVADRVGLPPSIVDNLSRDDHVDVRTAVARNPALGLSAEAFDRLVSDTGYSVRLACAARLDLLPDHVRLLKADPTRGVRQLMANRTNRTAAETLLTLLNEPPDQDESLELLVKEAAETRSHQRMKELSRHKLSSVREAVAGNPNCGYDLLMQLASDYLPVREAVARRQPRLPPDVVYLLFEDKNERVRISVAERSEALPLSVLDAFVQDQSTLVRLACVQRDDLHPVHVDQLARDECKAVRDALSQHWAATNRNQLHESLRSMVEAALFRPPEQPAEPVVEPVEPVEPQPPATPAPETHMALTNPTDPTLAMLASAGGDVLGAVSIMALSDGFAELGAQLLEAAASSVMLQPIAQRGWRSWLPWAQQAAPAAITAADLLRSESGRRLASLVGAVIVHYVLTHQAKELPGAATGAAAMSAAVTVNGALLARGLVPDPGALIAKAVELSKSAIQAGQGAALLAQTFGAAAPVTAAAVEVVRARAE